MRVEVSDSIPDADVLAFPVGPKGLPGLALPVAGGLTFVVLIGVWLTSAYWLIHNSGWPDI